MGIDAAHAIKELVANRFAGNRGAGAENFFDRAGMSTRGLLRRKPIWIAAAGPRTGNVVHILHDRGQPSQRSACRTGDRCIQIMRNKKGVFHAACVL
jgi:hypothetical protein